MSTSPYSLDLREKVIKFVESGNSQRLAAKIFNLSKTTINLWHVRYIREGSYAPKPRPGARSKIALAEFIKHVAGNPNSTVTKKRFYLLGSELKQKRGLLKGIERHRSRKSCLYRRERNRNEYM